MMPTAVQRGSPRRGSRSLSPGQRPGAGNARREVAPAQRANGSVGWEQEERLARWADGVGIWRPPSPRRCPGLGEPPPHWGGKRNEIGDHYPATQPALRHRGAILVIIMVCLVIGTAILGSLAGMAFSGRQSLRAVGWQMQARWLAESGIERAAARLAADRHYSGEHWVVPAQELGGPEAAAVNIRLETPTNQPTVRRVHVEADYPDDPLHRCRQSKLVLIELPKPSKPAK